MIKILMLTPVWKRPEIFRLFMWRFEAVKPDYAVIEPLFILSPEDPYLNVLERFTEGYNTLYYSNDYLGDKANAGMLRAMDFEWDYLLGMGSDNIYTPLLWQLYRDYFETGEKYFAINDLYVYDAINDRAMYIKKYVDDPALGGIGAGRVTHRSLLEDDPCIYRPRTNCGMDGFSAFKLYERGHTQKIVPTEGLPVMLDIKTNTNLNHPIEVWQQREREVPVQWVRNEFGLVDAAILDDGTFSLLTFEGFHDQVIRHSRVMRKEDAFNSVNTRYQMAYGCKRFKDVESYKVVASRKFKRDEL